MSDPTCECPPCPGRGNDGHGMTHCAECCFGTGVVADLDCPVHGIRLTPVGELVEHTITACSTCHGLHWCPKCEDRRSDLAAAIDRLVAEARAAALSEAAEFIAATFGIGRRSSDYADGWYDALNHAVDELRNLAAQPTDATPGASSP